MNKHAQALGRLGKNKPKTKTPKEMARRQALAARNRARRKEGRP